MARLPRLGSRLQPVTSRALGSLDTATRRMSGSSLQRRRYRLWLASPVCAGCGRVVAYPAGFELDHVIPLLAGGADTDDNCQILCPDCHAAKTRADLQLGRGGSEA